MDDFVGDTISKKRKKSLAAKKQPEKKKKAAPKPAAAKKATAKAKAKPESESESESEDSDMDADLLSAVSKGEAGVGWRVKVNWPKMKKWYDGTVVSYNAKTRHHKVKYAVDSQTKEEPLDLVGPTGVKWLEGPDGEAPSDDFEEETGGPYTEAEEAGGTHGAPADWVVNAKHGEGKATPMLFLRKEKPGTAPCKSLKAVYTYLKGQGAEITPPERSWLVHAVIEEEEETPAPKAGKKKEAAPKKRPREEKPKKKEKREHAAGDSGGILFPCFIQYPGTPKFSKTLKIRPKSEKSFLRGSLG